MKAERAKEITQTQIVKFCYKKRLKIKVVPGSAAPTEDFWFLNFQAKNKPNFQISNFQFYFFLNKKR